MRTPLRRFLDVGAVVVVAVYLAPLYWIAMTSVKPTNVINAPKPQFAFDPTLEHYHTTFERFDFAQAILNSGIIVIVSTIITMFLALISAYALARMKMRGADGMSLLILSLRFMPGVVIALPYFLMAQWTGLTDSHLGMIIVYVAYGLPFAVWLLRGFLLDLPREVEEAARLDGLGWFSIIWRIMLPMATSGIAVTAVFTFVFAWNEFLFALYLTSYKAVTIPVQIAKMIDLYNVLWGPLSAAVVIQLVPMLIVVFLIQRHMIRGLALGAVK